MAELNTMLLEQARMGLQAQLDAAVTNGDTEAARKASDELAKLAVSSAPKSRPYGDTEIKAALEKKADWFGVDPRKSGAAVRLGKDMNPNKFATAELFADALIKAVEEEFKPAGTQQRAAGDGEEDETGEGEEDETGEGEEDDEEAEPEPKPKPKQRRTDAPGEGDAGGARSRRATSGPWSKLSDAPRDVQKEINRTADKYAPKDKEGREKFVNMALQSHYRQHQQRKGTR